MLSYQWTEKPENSVTERVSLRMSKTSGLVGLLGQQPPTSHHHELVSLNQVRDCQSRMCGSSPVSDFNLSLSISIINPLNAIPDAWGFLIMSF